MLIKLFRRGLLGTLAMLLMVARAHAVCVLGMGNCLPDETAALQFIDARLATVSQPLFPLAASVQFSSGTCKFCGNTNTCWPLGEPDSQAASRLFWSGAQKIIAAIVQGQPCEQALTPRAESFASADKSYGGQFCKTEVKIPVAPFSTVESLFSSCRIMQALQKKGLITMRIERLGNSPGAPVKIIGVETPAAASLKMGNGIPVAKIGKASVTKNYTQVAMGTTIGTIEFKAPVIENEYAALCRDLKLVCGNPGRQLIGSIQFQNRSDGWALVPSSLSISRQ